jgi:hypothetical protein
MKTIFLLTILAATVASAENIKFASKQELSDLVENFGGRSREDKEKTIMRLTVLFSSEKCARDGKILTRNVYDKDSNSVTRTYYKAGKDSFEVLSMGPRDKYSLEDLKDILDLKTTRETIKWSLFSAGMLGAEINLINKIKDEQLLRAIKERESNGWRCEKDKDIKKFNEAARRHYLVKGSQPSTQFTTVDVMGSSTGQQ